MPVSDCTGCRNPMLTSYDNSGTACTPRKSHTALSVTARVGHRSVPESIVEGASTFAMCPYILSYFYICRLILTSPSLPACLRVSVTSPHFSFARGRAGPY